MLRRCLKSRCIYLNLLVYLFKLVILYSDLHPYYFLFHTLKGPKSSNIPGLSSKENVTLSYSESTIPIHLPFFFIIVILTSPLLLLDFEVTIIILFFQTQRSLFLSHAQPLSQSERSILIPLCNLKGPSSPLSYNLILLAI